MIEKDREPAGVAMAGVTFLLGRRMIRRLADALNIVVTGRATAEDRVVVHFNEREPLRRPVAVFAKIRRQRMIGWLRRCRCDPAADGMATHALRRCPLKDGADMAAFAIRVEMRTVEAKTRRQVIEI